jgi:preprotein translocase subunit SecB
MTSEADLIETQRTAARIAAESEVLDIRMFSSSFELKHIPGDVTLTWGLEVTPTADYSAGDDYFVITLDFLVKIESTVGDAKQEATESVANIAFQFRALYSLDLPEGEHPVEEAELNAYARSFAMLTVYPYAREYVHHVTGRLGLPPLLIDLFSLPYPTAWKPREEQSA